VIDCLSAARTCSLSRKCEFESRICQCVAVCCRVLQCVAVCDSREFPSRIRQCVLQCVAVCCNALQCVVVCDSREFESRTRLDFRSLPPPRLPSREHTLSLPVPLSLPPALSLSILTPSYCQPVALSPTHNPGRVGGRATERQRERARRDRERERGGFVTTLSLFLSLSLSLPLPPSLSLFLSLFHSLSLSFALSFSLSLLR